MKWSKMYWQMAAVVPDSNILFLSTWICSHATCFIIGPLLLDLETPVPSLEAYPLSWSVSVLVCVCSALFRPAYVWTSRTAHGDEELCSGSAGCQHALQVETSVDKGELQRTPKESLFRSRSLHCEVLLSRLVCLLSVLSFLKCAHCDCQEQVVP